MILLTQEKIIEGFWDIYANGTCYAGRLHYHPINGSTLILTLKTDDYSKDKLKLARILGETNCGKCMLLDTVLLDSPPSHSSIITIRLSVNIVCIGSEILAKNDKDFVRCDLRLSKLFNWIMSEIPTTQGFSRILRHCPECGHKELEITLLECLDLHIENMRLRIKVIKNKTENLAHSVEKKFQNDIVITLESDQATSVRAFINLAVMLSAVFSVFTDDDVLIQSLTLYKSIETSHDHNGTGCDFLFAQGKPTVLGHIFDCPAPVKYSTKRSFSLQLKHAMKLYSDCPLFYQHMQQVEREECVDKKLACLIKAAEILFNHSQGHLSHQILPGNTAYELEITLRKHLTGKISNQDLARIIDSTCHSKLSLKDKVFHLIQFAIDTYQMPHHYNYRSTMEKAVNLRYKIANNNPQYAKIFPPAEQTKAEVLLKVSIYCLFLQLIGAETSQVSAFIQNYCVPQYSEVHEYCEMLAR